MFGFEKIEDPRERRSVASKEIDSLKMASYQSREDARDAKYFGNSGAYTIG